MNGLDGKIAVVTGGTQGLGAAVARHTNSFAQVRPPMLSDLRDDIRPEPWGDSGYLKGVPDTRATGG